MMIYYLTTNQQKLSEAKRFFNNKGIEIESKEIDIPEFQAADSSEISKASAEYTAQEFNKPFFLMDRSFCINGLNGFPGPYVKFVNNWFNEKNMKNLFQDLEDTSAFWQTSIAYYDGTKIKVFEGRLEGDISKTPRGNQGYLQDKFFVPNGSNKSLAEFTKSERHHFWMGCESWKNFLEQIKG